MLKLLSWPNLIFAMPLVLVGAYLVHAALRRRTLNSKSLPPTEKRYDGATLDRSPEAMGFYMEGSYSIQQETEFGDREASNSLETILDAISKKRLPAYQTLLILSSMWGISGLLLNFLLGKVFSDPLIFLWLSTALALLISLAATRGIAFLCVQSTKVRQKRGLIGCEGRAMDRVTLESGMAQILDQGGTLHRVFCRIEPDGHVIHEGDDILVVGYDSDDGCYLVKRSPN